MVAGVTPNSVANAAGGSPISERARWQVDGASTETLTLSPSINILSGCKWHGWVRGGEVTDA